MPELTIDQANRGRKLAMVGRKLLELQSKRDRLPPACRGPVQQQINALQTNHQALLKRAGAQIALAVALLFGVALTARPCAAALIPIDLFANSLGQSNGVGKFGAVPPRLNGPQQHDFHYWIDGGAGNLTVGSGPLAPTYGYGAVFGSELSFGEAFANKIAIVKVAKSGSPIAEWARGGVMYTHLQETVAAAMADLVAQGYEPTFRGATWVQGEYDSGSAATAAAYESRLTQLIADLRTDYGQDFRFVFNQLHADLPEHWPSQEWVGDIRQAQLNVARSVPNVRMINVDGLQLDPRDNLHFSPAMQDTLGQWQAKAFQTPADLNYDGAVDGADFLAWQRTDGSAATLAAWQAAMAPAAMAVPEPTAAVLVLLLCSVVIWLR